MAKFTNSLENIKVASPCATDWNEMIGDERKRFCGACRLDVYNLSGMSRREAENLIVQTEERLCVRFYKRADGSVLTKDCPIGWQKLRRNFSKTATAFASLVFTALSGIGLTNYFAGANKNDLTKTISDNESVWISVNPIDESNTNASFEDQPGAMMGKVVVPIQTNEKQNIFVVGDMSNLAEVSEQIKSKRRR